MKIVLSDRVKAVVQDRPLPDLPIEERTSLPGYPNEACQVKCADCYHYTFSQVIDSFPGRCTGEPWDEQDVQAPQIPHECAGYRLGLKGSEHG
jgi:hypothetical protein